MILSGRTLETVASSRTLSAFVFFIILRCTEVWSHSSCSSASSSSGRLSLDYFGLKSSFSVNFFLNIDGIKAENAFSLLLFFLFWISFLFRMSLEVILNDASKGCISDSCGDLFPTVDAGTFFAIDQVSKASSTKSVIAWLNCHWDGHYFIAEGAGDLFLDRLSKLAWLSIFLL